MRTEPLELASPERDELTRRVRSRVARAGEVKVARLLLLLADGRTYDEVRSIAACSPGFIRDWKTRFLQGRLAGLHSNHRGRVAKVLTSRLEARILAWTQRKPTDGSTHWSIRRLAKAMGLPHMTVARAWQRAGLKPHRIERYMASNDPDFQRKAADILGLYLNPPQHAAVFCVDEQTAIQALDRLDPVLPPSPVRLRRPGCQYYRHGTLSLYAAFTTHTGETLARPAARHPAHAF